MFMFRGGVIFIIKFGISCVLVFDREVEKDMLGFVTGAGNISMIFEMLLLKREAECETLVSILPRTRRRDGSL